MSIFKDSFRDYVSKQFTLRDKIISLGNPSDFLDTSTGGKTLINNNFASIAISYKDRNQPHYLIRNNPNTPLIPPGAFFNYTLNKQCVIRMTSLVDYVDDVGIEIRNAKFPQLKGATLSQNFILEGGVLPNVARNLENEDGSTEPVNVRVNNPRNNFPRANQRANLTYGDFSILSDAIDGYNDGFGIVPMPGITDAEIRTKSAYGSLRESKVNFVCHNRRQLEVLEMLYMRPGYMVLLEWGWCPYFNNEAQWVTVPKYLENETAGKIYTNDITLPEIYSSINRLKEESSGNYDGLPGFVKNFGYQARPDGGYNCYTELISMGEVLDSLKVPNISYYYNESTDEEVKYGFSYSATDEVETSIADEFTQTQTENPTTGRNILTQEQFVRAYNSGIIPKKNGLVGLIRALYNAGNFNDTYFEGLAAASPGGSDDIGDVQYESYYEDEQNEILKQYEDSGVDNEIIEKSGDTRVLGESPQVTRIRNQYTAAGYNDYNRSNEYEIKGFLVDLIRFESTSIYEILHKKLQIPKEDLRNFFIAKSRDGSGSVTRIEKTTSETYIRWDALCVMINNTLIPKDEKGFNPISIMADRIYDKDSTTSIYEPLLYAPITAFDDLESSTSDISITDFSCDANVCILPHQFEIEAAGVLGVLNYKPELNQMPTGHTIAMYGRGNRTVIYNDLILDKTTNYIPADNKDKIRRIGGIFLNLKMLLNIAEQHEDDDKYTIGRFIKDIWDKVNEACPLHNFVITDDKESNVAYVIDLPVDQSATPKFDELHEFLPMSNANTLRTFDLQSEVPSSLSSTIAIQAQDPRNIEDIDGVTFAAFNKSIKNRIFSSDTTSTMSSVRDSQNRKRTQLISQNISLKDDILAYSINFFRNLRLKANGDPEIGVTSNIKGILKTFQTNNAYIQTSQKNTSSFNSVIPLRYNLETDGISGIVIGNIFKINPSRLPAAYERSNIGFIVFNESQTITAGQDWTTKLGGRMIILDDTYNASGFNIFDTELPSTKGRDIGPRADSPFSTPEDERDNPTPTESRGTGVEEISPGDRVFLKRVKTNLEGATNSEGKKGLIPLRDTPAIDNELNGIIIPWTNDNVIGMLDAWEYGGIELGLVKEIQVIPYNNGGRRVYQDSLSQYGITNPYFTFLPGPIQFEPDGTEYYLVRLSNSSPDVTKIYKSDTTDIQHIWFNVQINPSPEVSGFTITGKAPSNPEDGFWGNVFLNGWVLEATSGTRVDVDQNGADKALSSGETLEDYSLTGNVWIHDSHIAPDFATAIDINNNSITDTSEMLSNEMYAGYKFIENYPAGNPSAMTIVQSNSSGFYSVAGDIVIDGEVEAEAFDEFADLQQLKDLIDESIANP